MSLESEYQQTVQPISHMSSLLFQFPVSAKSSSIPHHLPLWHSCRCAIFQNPKPQNVGTSLWCRWDQRPGKLKSHTVADKSHFSVTVGLTAFNKSCNPAFSYIFSICESVEQSLSSKCLVLHDLWCKINKSKAKLKPLK